MNSFEENIRYLDPREFFKDKVAISFDKSSDSCTIVVDGEQIGLCQNIKAEVDVTDQVKMEITWAGPCNKQWWDDNNIPKDSEEYKTFADGFERYKSYIEKIKRIIPSFEGKFSK